MNNLNSAALLGMIVALRSLAGGAKALDIVLTRKRTNTTTCYRAHSHSFGRHIQDVAKVLRKHKSNKTRLLLIALWHFSDIIPFSDRLWLDFLCP